MGWFSNIKPSKKIESLDLEDSKIEIRAHKRATKKQVEKVKQANSVLNDLFIDNNFTLKIFLAAGGSHGARKH